MVSPLARTSSSCDTGLHLARTYFSCTRPTAFWSMSVRSHDGSLSSILPFTEGIRCPFAQIKLAIPITSLHIKLIVSAARPACSQLANTMGPINTAKDRGLLGS
jgi:hypothetical protein